MGSRNTNPNTNRNRNRKKKRKMSRAERTYEPKNRELICRRRRFTKPFKIGFYAPGTEPRRIPYHLYLLIKESVHLMQRGLDSALVDKKISFFCDFFYSHLPVGWKYDKENAASLIADYDTSLPKYDISGYTYLTYPYVNEFDDDARLSISTVFELMRTIYSRITPTPKKFMQWDEGMMSFYCKLCSCFGIDYLHLEAASKDDVVLMTRSNKCVDKISLLAIPYFEWVDKIPSNKRNPVFKHKTKLSSNDEAFVLSIFEIYKILSFVICSPRLPPQTTLTRWNEYQISFYSKMCSYFRVDFKRLAAADTT
ncbi:hypothetical protein HanOQP8_Chr12g0463501 [Helianthus annuus]|nr:uncharacterized protein LOC110896042 [Helianthus annuus]KAJ0495402.1 hypothetical protein HanIR_Chr12g0608381 [Helianthus annuus]KAJ0676578.1 hypothetical protein HanLR1_Chr12g0464331 [Helianthus annuus]KAJ0679783.1 hypothetical protein HanOQP8_Chr12g0463501 [Helianthus annuus]